MSIGSRMFFRNYQSVTKINLSMFNICDRIDTSMACSQIETAEIGFYRGIGFYRLGMGYKLDAIEAFNETIRLDSEGIYTNRSKQYLNKLHYKKD